MKKIVTLMAVLGGLTLGLANEAIDAQIEAIQNAPAQERVKLMNEFKVDLSKMKQEDRIAAISAMQSKLQVTKVNMTQNQDSISQIQSQENLNMQQMQNMNQKQAGNQFVQGATMPGATTNSAQGSNVNTNMGMGH